MANKQGKLLKIIVTFYFLFFLFAGISVFGMQRQTAIAETVDTMLMGMKLSHFMISLGMSAIFAFILTLLIHKKR